jgi:phage shock protein A
MALITRLSRLFHADMNAVLDQIEEPELLLKQAIREMEETLSNSERQIKLLALEQQKLLGQEDELKQSLTDLDKQLKLCFESDKDNLARSLVKRKLETSQYLKLVHTKISHSAEATNHLKVQLKEQQSQLSNMKQKADIFKQDNSASDSNWTVNSPAIQNEDIDIAFLAEKQKWSQS